MMAKRRKAQELSALVGAALGTLLLLMAVRSIEAAAQPWPDTSIWPNTSSSNAYAYKMVVSGTPTPVRDINGDENPDSTDVSSHGTKGAVGDWNSAYFYASTTNLFFRLLLNDNPNANQGNWDQYSWLVEIDANGDNVTDWRIGIAGVDELVYATCLSTGTSTTRSADPTNGYTRQVSTSVTGPSSGNTMYYADWQIELSALQDGAGGCPDVTSSTPIRLFYGTSANGQTGGPINKDYFTGSTVDFSNMTYVSADEPLAVTLASFGAQATADGVALTWETVSETGNTGFDVYRSVAADGERVRLAFVPATNPGSAAGVRYDYLDTAVSAGQTYWYWLEDVDVYGARTLHGPVSAVTGPVTGRRLWMPLIVRR